MNMHDCHVQILAYGFAGEFCVVLTSCVHFLGLVRVMISQNLNLQGLEQCSPKKCLVVALNLQQEKKSSEGSLNIPCSIRPPSKLLRKLEVL